MAQIQILDTENEQQHKKPIPKSILYCIRSLIHFPFSFTLFMEIPILMPDWLTSIVVGITCLLFFSFPFFSVLIIKMGIMKFQQGTILHYLGTLGNIALLALWALVLYDVLSGDNLTWGLAHWLIDTPAFVN